MSEAFDPYSQWLGIPEDQPPNHYRLLGVSDFEKDLDEISRAADERMALVKTYQLGKYSDLSQQILNELASARTCLLNPASRAIYDEQLSLSQSEPPPVQTPVEVPTSMHSSDAGVPSDETLEPKTRSNRMGPVIAAILCLGIGILTIRSCSQVEPVVPSVAGSSGSEKLGSQEGGVERPASPIAVKPPDEGQATEGAKASELPLEKTPIAETPAEASPIDDTSGEAGPVAAGTGGLPPTEAKLPSQVLADAVAAGSANAAFDLIERYAELQGDDMVLAKHATLLKLQAVVPPLDIANSKRSVQEALTMLDAPSVYEVRERMQECLAALGAFTPRAGGKGMIKKVQDRLVTLRDKYVFKRNLKAALEVAIVLAQLQQADVDRQVATLEFLDYLKNAAKESQPLEDVAMFSAEFLQVAENCDNQELYEGCSRVATTAARRHYLQTGKNRLLEDVTSIIIEFYEKCE